MTSVKNKLLLALLIATAAVMMKTASTNAGPIVQDKANRTITARTANMQKLDGYMPTRFRDGLSCADG